MIKKINEWLNAVINSYSIVFFSNHKPFAFLILAISFFNPLAGLSGLLCTIIAVTIAMSMGFNKELTTAGVYSFNALLIGIALGTFFESSPVFFIVLVLASIFTLLFSVALGGVLSKYGLPFLSLPFIISLWLVLLATKEFSNLGLSERNVYWINEMYAAGGKPLLSFYNSIESINMPLWLSSYFRALSAIFFQENILAGFLLALGFLLYSRIAFSLTLVAFFGAYFFNDFTGVHSAGINYYNLGSNYMMVAVAVGGFFTIPSLYSYIWAVLSIPLTNILVIALGKVFGVFLLPVFSLPFCIVILLFLYFLKLRTVAGKLTLTPIQHYSPEINLYQYTNNSERLKNEYYFRFYLPFIGDWMVSQGYEGSITHKGDWSKALDFVIVDHELKTYSNRGTSLENYYCYNKPVLAPADGYVHEIADHINDNEVGDINREQNWGNTIIIYHLPGLFTKLSHLKKNSFIVKVGDFVKKGQVLAFVGNSGRSPEPHLHFQVQSTPYIGSKTLAYPIANFKIVDNKNNSYKSFEIPQEGTVISNNEPNKLLQTAFSFQPGYRIKFRENEVEETWEVYTDAYNLTYITCIENNAVTYFISNENEFYFTSFYGTKKALLYQFYLSAFKVVFSYMPAMMVKDVLPLNVINAPIVKWVQDFVAPFYQFLKPKFELRYVAIDDVHFTTQIELESTVHISNFGISKLKQQAYIFISDNRISKIEISCNDVTRTIECVG